jgi:hypothetical protein
MAETLEGSKVGESLTGLEWVMDPVKEMQLGRTLERKVTHGFDPFDICQ